MSIKLKTWLGIGVFSLAQTGVPGLLPGDGLGGTERPFSLLPAALAAEGGEAGEGGASATEAKSDPVAYLVSLDVIAAHYLAGRDAYAKGETQAAGEMFAHPISEVYAELGPLFQERGAPAFDGAMQAASDAALAKQPRKEVDAKVAAVLASIKKAADGVPKDAKRSALAVELAVFTEMADRAARHHGVAIADAAFEPYLDGYGLAAVARQRGQALAAKVKATQPDLAKAINLALDSLSKVYPTVERNPKALAVLPTGRLLSDVSRVRLAAGKAP